MKKRLLSLAMALCLVLLLLPLGASVQATERGPACFSHLADYAKTNGTLMFGVYSVQTKSDDGTITMAYTPSKSELHLTYYRAESDGKYQMEISIPSTLNMPYHAVQTITSVVVIKNEADIPADFTTKSQLSMTGITVDDSNNLFVYGLTYLLVSTQEQFMAGTDYTIADLGFEALYEDVRENFDPEPTPTPLSITAQPEDAAGVMGDVLFFVVEAEGEGLTYQWQYSTDGGATWRASSSKDIAATCTLSSASRDGWLYRCIVTDTNGNTVTTDTAKVTVLPAITSQPKDASGKLGDVLKFTVAATGKGLTYQWQYSTDGGATWNASSSKTTSATCTLSGASRDGWIYRCIVTDANGKTVITDTAKVTVLPAVTSQPKDASGKLGDVLKFTVAATGKDLTYQWQYSTDGGATWNASSSRTTTATCTLSGANRDGWIYRCIVRSSNGWSVTSDTAKVTILK